MQSDHQCSVYSADSRPSSPCACLHHDVHRHQASSGSGSMQQPVSQGWLVQASRTPSVSTHEQSPERQGYPGAPRPPPPRSHLLQRPHPEALHKYLPQDLGYPLPDVPSSLEVSMLCIRTVSSVVLTQHGCPVLQLPKLPESSDYGLIALAMCSCAGTDQVLPGSSVVGQASASALASACACQCATAHVGRRVVWSAGEHPLRSTICCVHQDLCDNQLLVCHIDMNVENLYCVGLCPCSSAGAACVLPQPISVGSASGWVLAGGIACPPVNDGAAAAARLCSSTRRWRVGVAVARGWLAMHAGGGLSLCYVCSSGRFCQTCVLMLLLVSATTYLSLAVLFCRGHPCPSLPRQCRVGLRPHLSHGHLQRHRTSIRQ